MEFSQQILEFFSNKQWKNEAGLGQNFSLCKEILLFFRGFNSTVSTDWISWDFFKFFKGIAHPNRNFSELIKELQEVNQKASLLIMQKS